MADKPERLKRIVAWVSEEEHRKLKAKLALKGRTVADWLRSKIKQEIDS